MIEKIKCAALRDKNGDVYTGKRHADIINKLCRKGLFHMEYGFITTGNIFVSRKEAAKIAFKAGQIKEKQMLLYSGDISYK